jgi:hypothetical protein
VSSAGAGRVEEAEVTTDAAGDVTVRFPVFAAGSRPGIVWMTGAAIVFSLLAISVFLDTPLSLWYSTPIVLEIAYVWLIACYAYKTSVVRRDGTYGQRVTFLPALVRPKPGAAAICFERVYQGGVPSGNHVYPVKVRFADGTAYDLVWSAGGLEEARALATRIAEATRLPVEAHVPRTTSTGMGTLILITVAMCALPVLYIVYLVVLVQAPK